MYHSFVEGAMKSIKIVTAIILHDNQIFATERGDGDFNVAWLPADLGLIARLKETLCNTTT